MQNDIAPPPTESKPEESVHIGPDQSPKVDASSPQTSNEAPVISQTQKDEIISKPIPNNLAHEQVAPPKKSSLPLGVIIAAIIVCVGLIGLSIYMAVDESKNISKLEEVKPPTSASVVNPPDVQGAIDFGNKLEEQSGDLSADLTDQSLGL
jgi:hypothetical protein